MHIFTSGWSAGRRVSPRLGGLVLIAALALAGQAGAQVIQPSAVGPISDPPSRRRTKPVATPTTPATPVAPAGRVTGTAGEQAADGPAVAPTVDSGRIAVDAESLDYDRTTGWVHAVSNVVVRKGQQILKADRVRVNANTEQAIAEGNVWFLRVPGEEPWRGTKLEYNFGTREASIADLMGVSDPFVLKSEQSHRRSDGTFDVQRANMTTCTNAPRTHYHVRARSVRIVPGDALVCRSATLRFGRVPVFWFPYWRRDLNHDFGWHFYPGYNSRMGAFLLSSYRFPITSQLRGETHIDYRTERGVAGGQDFRWRDDAGQWDGEISGYYIQDDKPIDDDEDPATSDVEEERYRVRFEHDHRFGPRDYLLVNVDYVSDTDVLEDFFEGDYRANGEPDNYAVYTYRGDRYTVSLEARKRLNDFYDDLDRLPELSLDFSRQRLGNSSFYYEGENSAGYLEKLWSEGSGAEDYSSFRFDSRHMVSWPQKHFGFLNVIPRAGVRGTYYSATYESATTDQLVSSTTTNFTVTAAGRTNTTVSTSFSTNSVTSLIDGGADFRAVGEIGLKLSFKAFKTWQGGLVSPLRHIAEPYADYTMVPEPNLLPENIYQFDGVDGLGEEHNIKLGLRNKIQTKHDGAPFDLVDLDVYTWYRILEDGDKDGIGDVYMDAEIRPNPWFTIEADAHFDVDESELKTFNTEFTVEPENFWRASMDFRYTVDSSSLLLADMTLFPTRHWDYNVYGRYEFEDSVLEEVGGYLQRNLDCLAIRLGANYIPSYTRSDGSEKEDEWSVIMGLWLTAFPDLGFSGKHKH